QCELATKLSRSLVAGWLAAYMPSATPRAKWTAARIAAALARHANFKSHSRFISRDQAKKMGLVIDDLEADQAIQDAVLSIFHSFTHTFNVTPAVKIIENHLNKAFIKLQPMTMNIRMPTFMPQLPPQSQPPQLQPPQP